MEINDGTAFDTGVEHGGDTFGADHDSGFGADHDSGFADEHYSMIANDGSGFDPSGHSDGYGDTTAAGYSESATGGDAAGAPAGQTGGTVSIEVDGQTYTEPGTVDSSGAVEAHVSLPDGDSVIAIDTDHDGQADHAEILDSQGNVVDVQHEDTTTGAWIDDGAPGGSAGSPTDGTDPTGQDGTDSTGQTTTSQTGSDSSQTDGSQTSQGDGTDGSAAGVPGQEVAIEVNGHTYTAAEDYDVNQDGRADSGVFEADGKTYLVTDFNGDGQADHVEVGVNGEWKSGYSIEDGQFVPDPGTTPDPNDIPSAANYAVDPQTGEWVAAD